MEYKDRRLLDMLDRVRSMARAYELRKNLDDAAGAAEAMDQLVHDAETLAGDDLVDQEIRIQMTDGGALTGTCRGAARLPGDLRPRGVAMQHQRRGKWQLTVVPFASIREIQLPKHARPRSRADSDT